MIQIYAHVDVSATSVAVKIQRYQIFVHHVIPKPYQTDASAQYT